jgi:hypothetical protein
LNSGDAGDVKATKSPNSELAANRLALAERLDSLGLWRHLPDDVRTENRRLVAEGRHPWATTLASDVEFFVDGEEMAEGGVEEFLDGLVVPLAELGIGLDIRRSVEAETYTVTINGLDVTCYDDDASWDAIDETRHPWFTATVRPLAAVNLLLERVGARERFCTLYTGGNDGVALLIDPLVIEVVRSFGFPDNEIPLLAEPNEAGLDDSPSFHDVCR